MTATEPIIAPAAGQSDPIIEYEELVEPASIEMLARFARDGIMRRLDGRGAGFNDAETLQFTNRFATILTVSDLIGRIRIQLQAERDWQEFAEWPFPWKPSDLMSIFTPREALAFFRKIANIVVEGGTEVYTAIMEGRAFRLAATTDAVVTEKIARVIEGRIETGKDLRSAPHVVEGILEQSGIAHQNGYGRLVVRTNIIESYNAGAWSKFTDPDLDELYSVWRYIGIKDGRQRQGPDPKPNHRAKCGRYWPRSAAFQDVRGRGIKDVANCRCSFVGVTKYKWKRLQAEGAKLEESIPG